MGGDEGGRWERAADGPLHPAQALQVLLEYFYLRGEALGLGEYLVEVELLEVLLLLVEVGAVLVDVLVDHLDRLVLYHLLQLLLQPLHALHDVAALLDALPLDLVEAQLLLQLLDALLQRQQLARDGEVDQVVVYCLRPLLVDFAQPQRLRLLGGSFDFDLADSLPHEGQPLLDISHAPVLPVLLRHRLLLLGLRFFVLADVVLALALNHSIYLNSWHCDMRSLGGGEQLGLVEQQRRALAALAAELPAEGHHLLVVVAPELLLDVGVLLVEPRLLVVAVLGLLVEAGLDLLLEGSELCGLLGPEGVEGGLYFEVAGVEPGLLLHPLQLGQLGLHLVRLRVPTLARPYSFCLAMCSSIFLRLRNSEDSLTLKESCFSSSALRLSHSFWWRPSMSRTILSPSCENSPSFLSQKALKFLSYSSWARVRSLFYWPWRCSIS